MLRTSIFKNTSQKLNLRAILLPTTTLFLIQNDRGGIGLKKWKRPQNVFRTETVSKLESVRINKKIRVRNPPVGIQQATSRGFGNKRKEGVFLTSLPIL